MFSLLISSANAVASRIAASAFITAFHPDRALRNASVAIIDSSMILTPASSILRRERAAVTT